VLEVDPAEIGVHPSPELPEVWGGLVDMGFPNGTASLVALGDGTTSLYMSSGGGVIGGGAHEDVRTEGHALLEELQDALPAFAADERDELPGDGEVHFVVLSYSGRRVATASEDELKDGTHALSPAFFAAHRVITALRLITEQS
jgi:hypothetical protein